MEKTLRHADLPAGVAVYNGDVCLYSDDPDENVPDSSRTLVTVESDLQMVEDYLFIQKFRFRNRLQTEIGSVRRPES